MNPGERVASPRSMICAISGMATFSPAAVMTLPSTTTTPFDTSVLDLPSNRRAAFKAMTEGGVSANEPLMTAQQMQRRREKARFMGADIGMKCADVYTETVNSVV